MTRWGEIAELQARRVDLAGRIRCLKPHSFKRRALEALALELTARELLLELSPSQMLLPAPPAPDRSPPTLEPAEPQTPAQGDLYAHTPYWVEN